MSKTQDNVSASHAEVTVLQSGTILSDNTNQNKKPEDMQNTNHSGNQDNLSQRPDNTPELTVNKDQVYSTGNKVIPEKDSQGGNKSELIEINNSSTNTQVKSDVDQTKLKNTNESNHVKSDHEKGGTPEWALKRFAELTAQREAEKARADAAQKEVDYIKQSILRQSQLPNKPGLESNKVIEVNNSSIGSITDTNSEPKVENFETYDEYVSAVVNYQVNNAIKLSKIKEAETAAVLQRETAFAKSLSKFQEKTPDFQDVFKNLESVPDNPAAVGAIKISDQAPAIIYYLGKNLAEAHRISALPPLLAIKEIGKLEQKFSTPAPIVITQAPAPIVPLNSHSEKVQSDLDQLNMEDYATRRAADLAWKGRT